jgi:hypothetical protein
MSPSAAKVAGFLLIARRPPGFAIPIFREAGGHYIQDIDHNDIITAFAPCQEPTSTDLLTIFDSRQTKVGDAGLYAFVFPDGTITSGDAAHVKIQLAERLFELNQYKFLRLEVLRFLGREVDIPSAIQSAFERLGEKSLTMAQDWLEALGPPSTPSAKQDIGISDHTDSLGLAALGTDRFWHDEQRGASNKAVVYIDRGKVDVLTIGMPKLAIGNRKCEHGVILKIVTTNGLCARI